MSSCTGQNASGDTRCPICETGTLRALRLPYRRRRLPVDVLRPLRAAVAGEPLAAAHLEPATRALERPVAPFHRRGAARTGFNGRLGRRPVSRRRRHADTVGPPADVAERWVPRTPSGHPPARAARTPGHPALTPLHAWEMRSSRAGTRCRHARIAGRTGFIVSLQVDVRRAPAHGTHRVRLVGVVYRSARNVRCHSAW